MAFVRAWTFTSLNMNYFSTVCGRRLRQWKRPSLDVKMIGLGHSQCFLLCMASHHNLCESHSTHINTQPSICSQVPDRSFDAQLERLFICCGRKSQIERDEILLSNEPWRLSKFRRKSANGQQDWLCVTNQGVRLTVLFLMCALIQINCESP